MRRPMRAFFFTLTAASLALGSIAAAADKPAPRPERRTYRVLGLFAPDRVTDLREAVAELPDVKLVDVNFAYAEITLELIPSKAFPGTAAKDLLAALDGKLRRASGHTFGLKPRSTVAREQLKTVVIAVAGLDCKACALGAYEAVAQIDGVEQATASFKDGRVTARIDPARTNKATLEAALRRAEVKLPGR
jgi:copper chaperone CopZ